MADKKISQLTGTLEVQRYDLFPSARLGQNYQINFEQVSYTGITAGALNTRIFAGDLIPAHWYAITAAGTDNAQQLYVQATEYGKIHPTAYFNFNGEWMTAQIYDAEQDPLYIINPQGNWLGSPYVTLGPGSPSSPSTGTNFPIESRYQFRNNRVSDQQATFIQNKGAAVLVADNVFQGGNSIDGQLLTMISCNIYSTVISHTAAPTDSFQLINCDLENVTVQTDGSPCTLFNVTAKNCTLILSNAVNVNNCNILANFDQNIGPTFNFDGQYQGFVTDGWAGTIVTGLDGGTSTIRMNTDLDNFYDTTSDILNLPPDFPVGIYQFTNQANLTGPFPINTILGGNIFLEIQLKWAAGQNSGGDTVQFNYASSPATVGPDELLKYNQYPSSLTQIIYDGDHIHLQRESTGFNYWLLKGGNHYH